MHRGAVGDGKLAPSAKLMEAGIRSSRRASRTSCSAQPPQAWVMMQATRSPTRTLATSGATSRISTRNLGAGNEWHRRLHLVTAGHLQRVGEIHAGCAHAIRTWPGPRAAPASPHGNEVARRSVFVADDGSHAMSASGDRRPVLERRHVVSPSPSSRSTCSYVRPASAGLAAWVSACRTAPARAPSGWSCPGPRVRPGRSRWPVPEDRAAAHRKLHHRPRAGLRRQRLDPVGQRPLAEHAIQQPDQLAAVARSAGLAGEARVASISGMPSARHRPGQYCRCPALRCGRSGRRWCDKER